MAQSRQIVYSRIDGEDIFISSSNTQIQGERHLAYGQILNIFYAVLHFALFLFSLFFMFHVPLNNVYTFDVMYNDLENYSNSTKLVLQFIDPSIHTINIPVILSIANFIASISYFTPMGIRRLFKNINREGAPPRVRRIRIIFTMPLVLISLAVSVGMTDITALISQSITTFLVFCILCVLETTSTLKSAVNMIQTPTEDQIIAKLIITTTTAISSYFLLFSPMQFQFMHLVDSPKFIYVIWYLTTITITIYCAGFLSNAVFNLPPGLHEILQNTFYTTVLMSLTLSFTIGLSQFTDSRV